MNYYITTSGTSGATTIVQLPLAFVRSGWAKLDGGSMRVVGQYGYYWSRTSISTTNAYVLYINPTGVNPSGNGNRFVGLPLCCRTSSCLH